MFAENEVTSPARSFLLRVGPDGWPTSEADGKTDRDAAWIYREPKDAASNIKDHVAFWHGVVVSAAG